jgi:hypothetical protein
VYQSIGVGVDRTLRLVRQPEEEPVVDSPYPRVSGQTMEAFEHLRTLAAPLLGGTRRRRSNGSGRCWLNDRSLNRGCEALRSLNLRCLYPSLCPRPS